MTAVIDHTKQRFGRLVALEYSTDEKAWRCRCDCGQYTFVSAKRLRRGTTKSCGCLRREIFLRHGGSSECGNRQLYKTWRNIIERCFCETDRRYPNYGGRGIGVCAEWRFGEGGKHPFECFSRDMGPRPSSKHSIDRINNNGNYEPGNCRWATSSQQNSNKRKKLFCKRGHPLSGDNLIHRHDGYHECRSCAQIRKRQYASEGPRPNNKLDTVKNA